MQNYQGIKNAIYVPKYIFIYINKTSYPTCRYIQVDRSVLAIRGGPLMAQQKNNSL